MNLGIFAEKKHKKVPNMRKLIVLGLVLSGAPALAHEGGHLHPHGAEGWLVLAALAVIGVAVGVARAQR